MTDQIRWNIVAQAIDNASFANRNNNLNKSYLARIKHIQNNELLNAKEKEEAIRQITETKDLRNFFELKEQTYSCNMCGREGFTILNCEHCVKDALQSNFTSWT